MELNFCEVGYLAKSEGLSPNGIILGWFALSCEEGVVFYIFYLFCEL